MTIRKAIRDDSKQIKELIEVSARQLSAGYYSEEQIEAALKTVFGVDTALIDDGTYFIAEAKGVFCGCGGWSKRKTLFGGDQFAKRDAGFLTPGAEPAKIRAFFVHPQFARRGVGRAILERCEAEARQAGFTSIELMSTLPGVEFYRSAGYEVCAAVDFDANGVLLNFVPMTKSLAAG